MNVHTITKRVSSKRFHLIARGVTWYRIRGSSKIQIAPDAASAQGLQVPIGMLYESTRPLSLMNVYAKGELNGWTRVTMEYMKA